MKIKFTALTLATVAAFSAPAVSAATSTFSDTMTITEGANNVLNLTQFDSMGGALTLTGVQITITLVVPSFSIVVDNDAANLANVTAQFATVGSPTFSSTALTTNGIDSVNDSNFSVTTQNSSFDVAGNDTDSTTTFDDDGGPDNGTFTTSAVGVGVNDRDLSSAAFADWTGVGNVDLTLNIDFVTDLNINSGGGGGDTRFQGFIPSATYFAEVTYTYIPEPSTALLGALGALGLLRRRR